MDRKRQEIANRYAHCLSACGVAHDLGARAARRTVSSWRRSRAAKRKCASLSARVSTSTASPRCASSSSPARRRRRRLLALLTTLLRAAQNGGYTPLIMACRGKKAPVVKFLLAHPKIQVNKPSTTLWTAAIEACRVGSLEIMHLLRNHKGEKVRRRPGSGYCGGCCADP
jgi:hypothetical protein